MHGVPRVMQAFHHIFQADVKLVPLILASVCAKQDPWLPFAIPSTNSAYAFHTGVLKCNITDADIANLTQIYW